MYQYTPKGYRFVERDDEPVPPVYAIGEGNDEPVIDDPESDYYTEFRDAIEEAVWLSRQGKRWGVWQVEPTKYLAAMIYPEPKQEG
jgi:hypothetical protein